MAQTLLRHLISEKSNLARVAGVSSAQLDIQDALKNFRIVYEGSDQTGSWFYELLSEMMQQRFYRKSGLTIGY